MSSTALTDRKCVPCEKGTPPLSAESTALLLQQLSGWELIEDKTLRRLVTAKNFLDAVELINKISPIAEKDDHHPDLHLTGYKRLTIELSTHSIGGLSENDFILAAKLDKILPST